MRVGGLSLVTAVVALFARSRRIVHATGRPTAAARSAGCDRPAVLGAEHIAS
jgi:hypothetical protein